MERPRTPGARIDKEGRFATQSPGGLVPRIELYARDRPIMIDPVSLAGGYAAMR
jgi:hypothetical protein